MTDYIKREDLLELYNLGGLEVENAKVPLNVVIQNIKDMPSADVVSREDYEGLELVCKNYEEALKDAVDELEKVKAMDDYNDICYECGGYGDDYYIDDDGELVCACGECWVTKMEREGEDER